MNNSFVLRQARYFAERVQQGGGRRTRQRRCDGPTGWRSAAPPTQGGDESRGRAGARSTGWKTLCWVLLNASEFLYVR